LSKIEIRESYYREQLAYGIPVGLTAMIYVININIDKYMVGLFFSSSVFAAYYLGSLWAPMFGWITQSASQVITPRMSKAHKNNNLLKIKDLYSNSVEKLAFIFLPATVLLALIAKPLILTLFTDNYEDTVPIFSIYLLLLPTYALNLGWILMASGQTKFLLRLAMFMSIINIILSYGFLVTLEGDNRLLGIPFATVAVTWISTMVVMYQSLKTLESTLSETYNWKKMVTIGIISIISAIPVIGLLSLDLENKIFLISSILIYGITFLFTSFKFKILNDNEIDLVKSFLPFKN
jgi:O-antigen/teichoic acid export membrane protein